MNTEFTYKNLPAVGSVCEVEINGVYIECEILAHYDPCRDGDLVAVFAYQTRGGRSTDQRVGPCFRKSGKQIAVEKRKNAIHEMVDSLKRWGDVHELCGHLYDAGYRKFEIVEEDV